jgi:hypothetical protein
MSSLSYIIYDNEMNEFKVSDIYSNFRLLFKDLVPLLELYANEEIKSESDFLHKYDCFQNDNQDADDYSVSIVHTGDGYGLSRIAKGYLSNEVWSLDYAVDLVKLIHMPMVEPDMPKRTLIFIKHGQSY